MKMIRMAPHAESSYRHDMDICSMSYRKRLHFDYISGWQIKLSLHSFAVDIAYHSVRRFSMIYSTWHYFGSMKHG